MIPKLMRVLLVFLIVIILGIIVKKWVYWNYWLRYMDAPLEEIGRMQINKEIQDPAPLPDGRKYISLLPCTPLNKEEFLNGYLTAVCDDECYHRASNVYGVRLPKTDFSRSYLILTRGRELKSLRYTRMSGVFRSAPGGAEPWCAFYPRAYTLSHEYMPKTLFIYRVKRSEWLDKAMGPDYIRIKVQCPVHGEHYVAELYQDPLVKEWLEHPGPNGGIKSTVPLPKDARNRR